MFLPQFINESCLATPALRTGCWRRRHVNGQSPTYLLSTIRGQLKAGPQFDIMRLALPNLFPRDGESFNFPSALSVRRRPSFRRIHIPLSLSFRAASHSAIAAYLITAILFQLSPSSISRTPQERNGSDRAKQKFNSPLNTSDRCVSSPSPIGSSHPANQSMLERVSGRTDGRAGEKNFFLHLISRAELTSGKGVFAVESARKNSCGSLPACTLVGKEGRIERTNERTRS